MTRTVVFCGISADDVSAGGILQGLHDSGVALDEHYWITSRRDGETHKWAQESGVQVIRYDPVLWKGEDHTTVISEMLVDLRTFVSKDAQPAMVVSPGPSTQSIGDPNELLALDSDDEIRTSVAGYAKHMLSVCGNDTSAPAYTKFLYDYRRPIHMSWRVESSPPQNMFFGYTVHDKISSSSFSNVWQVVGPDGHSYALKVIQLENLEHGPPMDSFRRGVESMKRLSTCNVSGIARYHAAYEIPACIFMEFIDGPNLIDVVSTRAFNFWRDGLFIIRNIAKHLLDSHNALVLHRDLRPSNVMVPYFYYDPSGDGDSHRRYEVVVLNYDMSWHKDATGRTITTHSEAAGFYPPEQLEDINAISTRNSLVDSYGIGMTSYYCASREPPPPAGSKSIDWPDRLKRAFRRNTSLTWLSAPERLGRVISGAVKPEQGERLSMGFILGEIEQIIDALAGRTTDITADCWAEEVAASVGTGQYQVDASRDGAFVSAGRHGRRTEFFGNERMKRVEVYFTNQRTESTDRSTVDKLWPPRLANAKQILEQNGWDINHATRLALGEIRLQASISLESLRSNLKAAIRTLDKSAQ